MANPANEEYAQQYAIPRTYTVIPMVSFPIEVRRLEVYVDDDRNAIVEARVNSEGRLRIIVKKSREE